MPPRAFRTLRITSAPFASSRRRRAALRRRPERGFGIFHNSELAALVRDDYRAQGLAPDYDIHLSAADRTRDFSDDLEMRDTLLARIGDGAQRCLFDPIVSTFYRRRLRRTGAEADLDATDLSLQSIARADHARVAMGGAVLPSGPAVRRESTRPAAVDPPTCSRPYASCGARRRRGERTASGADRQRTA